MSPNSKVFELNLRTRVQFESSLSFTDWFQKDSKSKLHWKKYDRISSKIVKILFLFSQNQQKNPFRIRVDNKLLEIKLENLNQRPSLRWNSIIFISPSLSLSQWTKNPQSLPFICNQWKNWLNFVNSNRFWSCFYFQTLLCLYYQSFWYCNAIIIIS